MMQKKNLFVLLLVILIIFFTFVISNYNIQSEEPIVLVEPIEEVVTEPVIKETLKPYGPPPPVFDEQAQCLAVNLYHEARGESLAGQYAVSDVVLNRVESHRFPDTICGVVHQSKTWNGHPVRNKCHFSWYCDGKSDVPKDTDAWHKAKEVAISILDGKHRGLTEGSTHYHATYVNPLWNKNMYLVGTVGDHIFYIER